jgi:hypothetical protein
LAKVELKKMFTGKMVCLPSSHCYCSGCTENAVKSHCNDWFLNFQIKEVKETSLSTNQEKLMMKKMTWKVEGNSSQEPTPIRGRPVDNSTLIVELGPMEIRTFLLKFIL